MKKFLESEIPDLPEEECLFHVIPAPLEATVSYGGGTANGPEAILQASDQLEAFDGVSCPCEQGICTRETARTLEEIEAAVAGVLQTGGIPVVLGGEHTVTLGALRALKKAGREFGVVQFDAHADLRDEYEGSKLSHACVMRRAIDDLGLPLFQIGVRALSLEEHRFRTERNVPHLDAAEIAGKGTPRRLLPPGFPRNVYVTFDVDGLDPSVMPATGTPVPGGLLWYQATGLLETISVERTILGADFVELAPIGGLHAPDFAVAQLVYRMMGLIARQQRKPL
jgi:agmatinase